MPELPEVQTVVNNLNDLKLIDRTITAAKVFWPRTIADLSPQIFCKRIRGCQIKGISRRGKFIVLDLSNQMTLLIHLRMTGRLNWTPVGTERQKHEHVILELNKENELRFHDTRKFGRMKLTKEPQGVLDKLGPEPLDDGFNFKQFRKKLLAHKRQIKPLLLDQSFIAGLGNIYVDESLWRAKIHPLRISSSLSEREMRALHTAIPQSLRIGLKNMGTSLGSGEGNFYSVAGRKGRNADELKVFRRSGEACHRCQTSIERIRVGQRSSHICPKCQKNPL